MSTVGLQLTITFIIDSSQIVAVNELIIWSVGCQKILEKTSQIFLSINQLIVSANQVHFISLLKHSVSRLSCINQLFYINNGKNDDDVCYERGL